MYRSGPTTRPASRISASGTARSMPAAATPISIRRPGTNSPACSASPTISPTSPPNTRTASTCISIGAHRNSLTKQVQVGLAGYVYKEIGCDSGSGDRVGCFQSQVVGVGPQLGFIVPLSTTTQGYLNFKGYKEFANQNRPDGWNTWVTFVISPAEQTPSAPPRRMIMK